MGPGIAPHGPGLLYISLKILSPPGMEQYFLTPAHLPFLEVRTTFDSALPYSPHFHSGFSLGIMLAGRTAFKLEKSTYQAEQGALVLIGPGLVHGCNPVNGGTRSYHMLVFEQEWFSKQVAQAAFNAPAIQPENPLLTCPLLYERTLTMVSKLREPDALCEEDIANLLEQILRQTGVACLQQSPGPVSGIGLPNGDQPATVSALARNAGMRRESFTRAFRRRAGLPPQAYLHCLRVEKGRALLRQGKSISETAYELGYTDQSHFHRMFVKLVSATPGCYRKTRSHSYKK